MRLLDDESAERSLEIRNADSIIERVSVLREKNANENATFRARYSTIFCLPRFCFRNRNTAQLPIIPRVVFLNRRWKNAGGNSEAASSATTARGEFVREQRRIYGVM